MKLSLSLSHFLPRVTNVAYGTLERAPFPYAHKGKMAETGLADSGHDISQIKKYRQLGHAQNLA